MEDQDPPHEPLFLPASSHVKTPRGSRYVLGDPLVDHGSSKHLSLESRKQKQWETTVLFHRPVLIGLIFQRIVIGKEAIKTTTVHLAVGQTRVPKTKTYGPQGWQDSAEASETTWLSWHPAQRRGA